ncbi:MAG TPA: chromosomal replication initiator protein DnaA [Patescibacteria group bacterium]|nr:chromosomal replication initiator protein DnaA [Patescibacteria group bacterium]
MKQDKVQIWHDVLESVKVSVSAAIFSTWISQTELGSLKKVNDTRYLATIVCNSYFVKQTIQERYFGLLQDSLMKAVDAPVDLEFTVGAVASVAPKKEIPIAPLFAEDDKDEDLTQKLVSSNIRLGFTFENFAVSGSNQMAYAAAQSIAATPGIAYNPLFIWGGVGVGKTHLMQAVGFKMIKSNPNAKVLLCSAEEFTNEVVQGIRNKTTQAVRDKYRKLQGLFVDDIQFISGKEGVQEEFFHTFNAVVGSGGQIILTSDTEPSKIKNLEDRLKSRFEAGLTVDIGKADFELKCAIIQIKGKEKGIELPIELVSIIAGNIEGARQIQGFLTRLFSESKIKNIPIDENLVKSLLSKGGDGIENLTPKEKVSPEKVFDAVSTHFSVSKKALLSHVRSQSVARPRQILMYLLRIELGLPFDEIGQTIGGRDHSTVMHAVEKVTSLASSDAKTREDIMGIKQIL